MKDGRWYDLIVILDDANSEIYYARLVEEESTRTVMTALRQVIGRTRFLVAISVGDPVAFNVAFDTGGSAFIMRAMGHKQKADQT